MLHQAGISLAAFLASFVEFVEALTVVLALGATRGWRSALAGAAGAAVLLAALVAGFGPALQRIDLRWLQLPVGVLVLLFALRWLRKAILRAAGHIPLHDETVAYARTRARYATTGKSGPHGRWDAAGLAGAFQVTMLEGSEVVFIVVAMGAGGARLLSSAVWGAAAALLCVVALGALLHRPLANVPENTLKLMVGVLLAAFGTFWTGEAIGAAWPGGDAALPLLGVGWGGVSFALIRGARKAAP